MSKVQDAYKEIEKAIGDDYITDKDFMKAAYSRNVDPAFPDRWADIIVRPGTPEEVSEIVKIANKYKIVMVPRGGGADLVGGSVTQGGILLDLTRMNKIIEINTDDYYVIVECGITWGDLVSQIHPTGYTTGIIGPGSGYSATIGGGLSNSTAGGGSTKYGLVPDICLGVEIVLPNPQGTIIRTGSAANKYAEPFCRYGVSPDFTGLFMGDVGTMGIKTKAFLRLFRDPQYKKNRSYILKKNDYQKIFEFSQKIRFEVADGLRDLMVLPPIFVQMFLAQVGATDFKLPRAKGPYVSVTLEAVDPAILDILVKKVDEIMLKDEASFLIEFPGTEDVKWDYNLKQSFHFFQPTLSPNPPRVGAATCHKVPISSINEVVQKNIDFGVRHKKELPPGNYYGFFASMLYFLPNGNYVVLGSFSADNIDSERKVAMDLWHKKTRDQVRYGAAHYWLGESISQSVVEAGAYTPEYMQFFKDVKKAVDPNFLLSPKKFHLYSYDDDYTKYLVKDDEE